MTTTGARTRRALALSATGLLTAGLAWLPAGSSSAAVAAVFTVAGHAVTGSGCTLTAGDAFPVTHTSSFSDGTRTRSVDLDATFTDTVDPADVVRAWGHYSGSATVDKRGGDLRRVLLSGQGSVSIDSAEGAGTACDPSAYVAAGIQLDFRESSAGWLYVNRSTVDKPGLAETILVKGVLSDSPVVFDLYQGNASELSTRGFVTPGRYAGNVIVGLTAGSSLVLERTLPQSTTSVVFHRAGSALRKTSGPGKVYLSFPTSEDCSSHRAVLRWRPSASKVASAAFFVNGKRRTSVSTPRGGQKVVLRHLRSTADITLGARLNLRNGSAVSARRHYVPCRG